MPASPDDAVQIALQVNVLPGRVREAAQLLVCADPQCTIQAHAGDGVLRAWLNFRPRDQAARHCQRLRGALSALGGKLIVHAHPADLRFSRDSVWGPPGPVQHVLSSLKNQFDPQGILNRGRFVY